MTQIINTIIRHLLGTFAGGLIADGTITDGDIQVITGAVIVIGVIAWSIIEKKYFTKK